MSDDKKKNDLSSKRSKNTQKVIKELKKEFGEDLSGIKELDLSEIFARLELGDEEYERRKANIEKITKELSENWNNIDGEEVDVDKILDDILQGVNEKDVEPEIKLEENTHIDRNADLSYRTFGNVKNLTFEKGVFVSLQEGYQIPENLDVSNCSEVWVNGSNAGNIKSDSDTKVLILPDEKDEKYEIAVSKIKNFEFYQDLFDKKKGHHQKVERVVFKDFEQYREFASNHKEVDIDKSKLCFGEDRKPWIEAVKDWQEDKTKENLDRAKLKEEIKNQKGEVYNNPLARSQEMRMDLRLIKYQWKNKPDEKKEDAGKNFEMDIGDMWMKERMRGL